jgi:hypothetical protein
MEDLQDSRVLQNLFPDSDQKEIHSIQDIILRITAMKERAVLSTQSSVKILKAIKTEWKEELEKSGSEISRSIFEKLRAVYENEGWRGLQLRPMLVPVTVAAILVIFTYAPHVVMPFSNIAGKTVSSLSAVTNSNVLLIGGVVIFVALALIVLASRNSKK